MFALACWQPHKYQPCPCSTLCPISPSQITSTNGPSMTTLNCCEPVLILFAGVVGGGGVGSPGETVHLIDFVTCMLPLELCFSANELTQVGNKNAANRIRTRGKKKSQGRKATMFHIPYMRVSNSYLANIQFEKSYINIQCKE